MSRDEALCQQRDGTCPKKAKRQQPRASVPCATGTPATEQLKVASCGKADCSSYSTSPCVLAEKTIRGARDCADATSFRGLPPERVTSAGGRSWGGLVAGIADTSGCGGRMGCPAAVSRAERSSVDCCVTYVACTLRSARELCAKDFRHHSMVARLAIHCPVMSSHHPTWD